MATTDFTRTPSSGGNRKIWTFSAWVKRALKSDSNNSRIFSAGGSSSDYTSWFMYDANGTNAALQLQNRLSGSTTSLTTNRKFRDMNGWYHIVIACDTTQATASNRMKIYVNGVQETSFSTEQYPAQDANTHVNHTVAHNIGSSDDAGYTPRYWAGSMSHVALVDGQQLTPTSFGSTDSTSGIWKFKAPAGITWGTNGFHLKFENSGNMGLDSSGQTNNFTTSGGTPTQSLDTPSNAYTVLNGIYNPGGTVTYTNANNTLDEGDNQWKTTFSTLGASSGKYYAEFKCSGNYTMVGVADYNVTKSGTADRNFASTTIRSDQGYGNYNGNGDLYYRGSSTSYGDTYGNGDIVQVALDCDNNRVFFGKNGTWQNSADPTSAGTGFAMTATNATYVFALAVQTNPTYANFGNGFFGTTAITSAGSNGNGSLFEYDVPSGYYALNTKNLNTYG